MPKLTVHLPRTKAEAFNPVMFGAADSTRKVCVISINEPGQDIAVLRDGWDDKLITSFWDITFRLQASNNPKAEWLETITEEQIKEIAEFINAHNEDHIVVHCRAGISRSAAVARLLVDLGWQFDFSNSHHDMSGYNVLVYTLLKKHFPELLPIGA